MGSCSLLQGIFPTQGSNPGLPHCRQILYQLSHREALAWVKGNNSLRATIPERRMTSNVFTLGEKLGKLLTESTKLMLLEALEFWCLSLFLTITPRWPHFDLHACVVSCLSCIQLGSNLWTAACQASLSMGILQARILQWVAGPPQHGFPEFLLGN